jgi:serine O-acetyltransferase
MNILRKLLLPVVAGYNENAIWNLKHRCLNTHFLPLKMFFLWSYNRNCMKFGAYIGYNAIFAEKPVFPHGLFGVFISDKSTIGNGCVIFQQVTIGSNTLKETKDLSSFYR